MSDPYKEALQSAIGHMSGRFATLPQNPLPQRICNCIGPQNGDPVCPCRMATLVRVPGVGLVQIIVPEAQDPTRERQAEAGQRSARDE